jgi:hypothetical protein
MLKNTTSPNYNNQQSVADFEPPSTMFDVRQEAVVEQGGERDDI